MTDGLSSIKWNDDGLVPVIIQDINTHHVLMHAWMNESALMKTLETGKTIFWSRSRQRLWQKGEESGHYQTVHELRLDCDGDTLLIQVEQKDGVACHTGRAHCFYRQWQKNHWHIVDPIIEPNKL